MKDYKGIFEGIESTLLEVGSKHVPIKTIKDDLSKYKAFEGMKISDAEAFRKLVHIVFYSGFRAQTVGDKLGAIDKRFPDFETVASFTKTEIDSIVADPGVIRNRRKIAGCVKNAKAIQKLVQQYGSFQAFVDQLPSPKTREEILGLRDKFSSLFSYLGPITAFHFMMDVGIPVLKPDRVLERMFKRLGLVPEEWSDDPLYIAMIQEGQKFAEATGYPIRYIDIVFVCYGQVQNRDIGIERGICLSEEEGGPDCNICGTKQHCSYYTNKRRAASA